MHFDKNNTQRFLLEIRTRKLFNRLARKRKIYNRILKRKASFAKIFGDSSKIIAMMAGKKTVPFPSSSITFSLPKLFSIIDAPKETIRALVEFSQTIYSSEISDVFLNFSKVEQQDLAANCILDVLVHELGIQGRLNGSKIHFRGNYPAKIELKRFLKSMGIIKRLKIKDQYPTKDEMQKLVIYNTRCRHYIRALKPMDLDRKSKAVTEFSDHINKCLIAGANRTLTKSGRMQLCLYVAEIIDNAEEHAGMHDWSIEGYLDTHLSEPVCEIVIFNFGKTIAEKYNELEPSSYTKLQTQEYIDLHYKNGFFSSEWKLENLQTLIALQGAVSSKNTSPTDTRGNGSVDLITYFQQMHTECAVSGSSEQARMVILSGSTYILFDGKYKMASNENGVNIMAFNSENDLRQKPDAEYVCHLDDVSFPGTVISIKFPLSDASSSSIPVQNDGAI